MWRKLLNSGFGALFGQSTKGAGIRYQNTSQIQILLASHVVKKGRMVLEYESGSRPSLLVLSHA